MKHSIFIPCIAALFCLAACVAPSNPATDGTETTDTTTVKASHIKTLNTQDFIREIYDFRSGAAWNYLGSKPCVIDFYTDWCRPWHR